MSIRHAGFLAPFRWWMRALDIGAGQPLPVMAAVAVLVLVAVAPGLPLQAAQMAGQSLPMAATWAVQALTFAIGLLIVPVLMGGVYGVFRQAERGAALALPQVFAPFSDGRAGRLVLTNLLFVGLNLMIALLIVAVIAVLIGDQLPALVQWAQQLVEWQQKVGNNPEAMRGGAMPPMPGGDGMGALMTVAGVALAFSPLLILVSVGGGLANADAALHGSSPLLALRRGLGSAFLHAPGWLAFFLVLILLGGLVAMLVAGLIGLVIGLLAAISPLLGALVGVPIYLLVMLVVYALGMGTLFHAWRDTLDSGASPEDASTANFAA